MSEKKVKEKKKGKVGIGRHIAWQSSSISSGCVLMALGFISVYCTDALEMPAALVGTLLMVSKLFDGFTDLLAGYIVDNTNTKWGRGRPYELCLIGAWLCTVILYSCPAQFSLFAKSAWVLSMYILINSVFQTFLKATGAVYLARAFKTEEEIVSVSSIGHLIVCLGTLVFNVVFPMAMGKLATSPAGWRTLMLIFAVPLLAFGMLRFFFIKETNQVDVKTGKKERISFKEVLLVLKNNRYIWVLALMGFALNFVTNMGVSVYYYKHVLHNVGIMSIMAFSQIFALPFVFVFPKFIKKFSAKKLVVLGFLMSSAAYLLLYIAYDNVPLLLISMIITGMGAIPVSAMGSILTIECADYNEWKGMERMEGTIGSVRGFASKIGAGIGSGLTGILLGMSGYISSETATQPDSAILMIRMMFSIVPMVLYLLVALTMKFYDLDKKLPEIKAELQERREIALGTEKDAELSENA